jgi:branched-chain amino acid transport system substrate-binding protein
MTAVAQAPTPAASTLVSTQAFRVARWVAMLVLCAPAVAQQAPYKDRPAQPSTFEGPGREAPEPADIREVLIGYYGPQEGAMWRAATLAIEEANREGGYSGKPFRLLSRWSANPWRAGAALITRMAMIDRVWAIVGSVEGAGTHLAEQIVVKALLPLVNPVATDRSIHEAGVPWMFSVVQGDNLHAATLAPALRGRSVVVLVSTDHDSRAFRRDLKVAAKFQFEFEPGRPDFSGLVRDAAAVRPDAIVVIADVQDSARLVKSLRAAGYAGTIAGSPLFGRRSFIAEAGAAAEGAIFPWVGPPSAAFRARLGAQADYAAAGAYDSVRLVIAAVRKAGLNRARIRDAIAAASPYDGAGGRIEWDPTGQNRRPPVLAVIRAGSPTPAP